jgi:hypothetical protein
MNGTISLALIFTLVFVVRVNILILPAKSVNEWNLFSMNLIELGSIFGKSPEVRTVRYQNSIKFVEKRFFKKSKMVGIGKRDILERFTIFG